MLLKNLLKSYHRKLTNLTSGNRSIVVLKCYEDSDLDLFSLEYAELNRSSFQIIEQLIKARKSIKLCEYIDSRDADINKLSKKISKIFNKCKMLMEERGTKDLYVGYPFVTGKLQDGSIVRCPLIFFPIEIQLITSEKGKSEWHLLPIPGELPFLNRSFLLAYAHFNKLELNEDLLDFNLEEDFEDSLSFRNWLYEFLKLSQLNINFNSDLFLNQLKPFENVSKSDFESRFEDGNLRLEPFALLGIFPQSGSYLAPDYEQWISQIEDETVDQFYEDKYQTAKPIKEENVLTAFPIDASQEAAIVEIKSGKSMVVQGPPGTGKSQLICNLATDFAANGKKVLVVCQKRAALEVVHQRLSKIGLEDFVAQVHDYKADRKRLFGQLNSQINQIDSYKTQHSGFDSTLIERDFLHTSRSISEEVEKLESFKTALFGTKYFGISPKELYLGSSPLEDFVDLNEFASKISFSDSEKLIQTFNSLFDYAVMFEKDDFEWKDRLSFKNLTLQDIQKIKSQLDELLDFIVRSQFQIPQLLQFNQTQSEWSNFSAVLKNPYAKLALENIHPPKSKTNYKKALETIEALEKIAEKEPIIFQSIVEAGELAKKLSQALSSHQNFLSLGYYKIFNKDKKLVLEFLVVNRLSFSEIHLQKALEKIDLGIEWIKTCEMLLKSLVAETSILTDINRDPSKLIQVKNSIYAAQLAVKSEIVHQLLKAPAQDWMANFERIKELGLYFENAFPKWKLSLTETQVISCFEQPSLVAKLKTTLESNFETLVVYDQLLAQISAKEWSVFQLCWKFMKDKKVEKAAFLSLVKNSLYIAWIDLIEQKEPILKATETLQLGQWEQELQTLVQKKQRLATDIIKLKLKERIYKNNVFNRLNNRITYRDLQHQLTKKRKIWKLRKVLENFHEEVFDLTPIWLVSPETVSAVFPFETIFDLVIFDEASQCFAEKGFPAMYRGKQIVVAGDSKQLQPNDLYLPRFESETDLDTDSEIDSLLNISEKYIQQTTLTGHYRSLLPELIAFSNQHFYENNLHILPDFELMQKGKSPIHYVKTEGIWKDNCNALEADMILSLSLRLIKEQPSKQLGIITFNAKQQELISLYFEKYAIEHHIAFPEWLFIKNIENVQGDERDIILFSTAYAPDTKGKMQMQFGSLNQLHGENRLNVAITRAKDEIYLITSIWPAQLLVENTLNEGPKLLKKYMQYAHDLHSGNAKQAILPNSEFNANWYLKNRIANENTAYQLFNLPFADLVEHNGTKDEQLLLTDDEYLYSSRSMKDFFAYHPLALKNKNWRFKRFFSRTYWKKGFTLRSDIGNV